MMRYWVTLEWWRGAYEQAMWEGEWIRLSYLKDMGGRLCVALRDTSSGKEHAIELALSLRSVTSAVYREDFLQTRLEKKRAARRG